MTLPPRAAAKRPEGRALPRGRQASVADHAVLAGLLGDAVPRRDHLIEYLHLLQDHFGHLPAPLLVALAEWLRLPLADIYETATFYAHFEVVGQDEAPPPRHCLRVCDGVACQLAGGDGLAEKLRREAGPDTRVVRVPCIGQCDHAPAMMPAGPAAAPATAISLEGYRREGGYVVWRFCQDGALTPDAVIDELQIAGLRGMGGAGFPTARKWRAVLDQPGPRHLVVNADEGEPGTFKDRHFLETDPHGFLEGALMAAWVIGAEKIYIYLRDEYPALHALLRGEIALLRAEGLLHGIGIELRRGAGAYICGEESALLESLEGKRGLPRHKPPYPFQAGLFGQPTLINNVETLYWARAILQRGADWWQRQGRNGGTGLRAYSVSGRVKQPGVKIAPAGITLKELLAEYCGGMADGHELLGYLPGGASGGILPARLDTLPLDFGSLEPYGCFIGSAAVVVFSRQDDPRRLALNLMEFFRHESCGQCTPCRVGTEKAAVLMQAATWDEAALRDLAAVMRDASICGLGQAAPNPLLSVLEHFR